LRRLEVDGLFFVIPAQAEIQAFFEPEAMPKMHAGRRRHAGPQQTSPPVRMAKRHAQSSVQ